MRPSGGARAGCCTGIGRYAPVRRAPLNARAASLMERDWLVVPATDLSKFGGEIRFWKILDGKLLQKLERVHGRIVGSLGSATWVSVAAWLLDGIVPFRCKLMHARTHRKLP